MKRRRRTIFNALVMFSLLLCIVAAALWIRSYQVIQNWLPKDGGYNSATGQLFRTSLCPRCALLSEAGRLTLLLPPPSPPVARDIAAEAIELSKRLRNGDVEFRARFARNIPIGGEYPAYFAGPANVRLVSQKLRDRLESSQPLASRLASLLLRALDRPESKSDDLVGQ